METTKEVIEGNRIIGEFMGMREGSKDFWVNVVTGKAVILGEYRPDKDWNELMPVVEKIENMEFPVSINPTKGIAC